jgi:hypothetical protein
MVDSSLCVIIPFNGNPDRWEAAEHVRSYYESLYLEVVYGWCDGEWCKGRAIQNGLEKTVGARLVIVDADLIVPDALLNEASAHPWAIPFNEVHNLTETGTRLVLDGGDIEAAECERIRKRFDWSGGCWIIDRDIYERVGVDVRFTEWGGEDESFVRAVNTMYGKVIMVIGKSYHLWHPDNPYKAKWKRRGNAYVLYQKYRAATGNREKMERVIEGKSRKKDFGE